MQMRISPQRWLAAMLLALLLAGSARADFTLQRGPFTLRYQEADAHIVEASANTLEDCAREFATRLPLGPQPVEVIIAGTYGEFIRRAGSFANLQVAGIARPAQGQIVVQSPRIRSVGGDYLGTLRHELLHILLHRNTGPERLPRWLNEGLCMSYANEYAWQGGLRITEMFLSGRTLSLTRLNRAFTLPGDDQEFDDAYAQALSMVRFLRNRLGEDTLWAVIAGTREDFFEVSLLRHTGVDLPTLWGEYERSLWVVALIGVLTSGSLLGPGGFILAAGWWRTRRARQARLREMAEEERRNGDDIAPLLEFDEAEEDQEESRP